MTVTAYCEKYSDDAYCEKYSDDAYFRYRRQLLCSIFNRHSDFASRAQNTFSI